MNRTDLACELAQKPEGNYATIYCDELDSPSEIAELSHILGQFIPKEVGKTLVVGLGNESITPDSLGVRAARKVLATAHFKGHSEFTELNLSEVYVVSPGVMAQTGLESAQLVKSVADLVKPDCLVVIDSLACSKRERLAKTIQVTDRGIAPGSGVKNERMEFSRKVFGMPVVAIGVPTVIDVDDDMLVPRDIDVVISHYARVISGAVNRTLNPGLSESEIEQLLM